VSRADTFEEVVDAAAVVSVAMTKMKTMNLTSFSVSRLQKR
jgi:hypothetical protein